MKPMPVVGITMLQELLAMSPYLTQEEKKKKHEVHAPSNPKLGF